MHEGLRENRASRSPRGPWQAPRTWLGVAISALVVGLILWRVWPGRIARDLRTASVEWLAIATALKLAVVVAKGVRWGVVARAAQGGWPRRVIAATFVGAFGNAALPARLGELARVEVLRRHNPLDRPALYATVVLERMFDLLVVLVVFALVMLVQPLPGWAAGLRAPLAVLLALGVVVGGGLALGRRARGLAWVPGWFGGRLRAGLGRIAERAASGLAMVRSARQTALAFAVTAVAWSLEIAGTWAALRAFGLALPVTAAALVTSVVSLGVAIPSAPSGLGTAQALYAACLGLFSVSADLAVSISVMMTAIMLGALAVIGLACLWREGLSLRAVARGATPPPPLEQVPSR